MKLCSIDACSNRHHANGWCRTHYGRWKRHGNPLADVREQDPSAKQAWIEAASVSATDECIDWPWGNTGGIRGGYGFIRRNGRNRLVHVLVGEIVLGPKPDGMEAAHSCGRRVCANPRHLRWATPKENQGDRIEHGTNLMGDQHPGAKLTWYAVHWIRSLYATGDYSYEELSEMFGVAGSTIGKIIRRERWAA